jgi:hypothetical protein
MSSELKSETARINGAKSHGPKTPEGKHASSLNSLKHGFTSRKTLILQTESADEYQDFLAEHIAIHQPATLPESELVDQMAIARWRIRRFVGAETVLIDCEMVRNHDKVDKEFGPTDSQVHLALAIRSLADESRCLSLMSRYESRLQRCHDKAYAAFRELQRSRDDQPSPPAPHSPAACAGAVQPAPDPEPPPAPTTHNPSVSAGFSVQNKDLPNEPTAPPLSSPGIHLCTPVWQVDDLPSPPESKNSAIPDLAGPSDGPKPDR